jgi:hypothetical protein
MSEEERLDAIARFLEMPEADQLAHADELAWLLGLTDSISRVQR